MSTNSSLALILSANAKAFVAGLKQAEKSFETFGRKMTDLGGTLSTAVSLPLGAIAAVSVNTAMKMDSLKRGLTAVAGSSEEAEKQLVRLKEVAKLPGLGFEEAIQGSINLQAAGFSAEQSEASLKAFGNALATVGKGKADLEGVIMALGQIASKGKISAEEINQLAERVPQIRKVIQNVFGTADTEALQKMGIDATFFVQQVTDELAKLPPVSGGIQNAFENLGDNTKNAFAAIGESINQNFNLEGLFNSIGEAIGKLAQGFTSLDPTLQKVILSLGGVAIAIGPVLTGIGFFSTRLLPMFTSGLASVTKFIPMLSGGLTGLSGAFAILTGPIGLVAAAVVAAVALIYQNWDSIVSYFTEGPGAAVWNTLQEIISKVMSAISSIFESGTNAISAIWEKIGPFILNSIKGALDQVMKIIGFVLDTINDIIDFWANVFSGNWQGAWDAVKRIFQRAINFVIDLVFDFIEGTAGVFNTVAKALGFEGFDNAIQKVREFGDSLKFVIPETQKVASNIEDMAAKASKSMDQVAEKSNKAAMAVASVAGKGKEKEDVAKRTKGVDIKDLMTGVSATPMMPVPNMDEVQKRIEAIGVAMEKHQEQVQATEDSYRALGEQIGASMNQSATSLKDFTENAGKALLNFVLQAVKAFAAQAIAGLIAQSVATLGPAGLVAAAAAPGIVNGLFDSLVPKFAEGGIVNQATLGIFGEAGAEAVIPLNRLPSLVGQMQPSGAQQVEVFGTIRGKDIYISNSLTTRSNSRSF